MSFFGLDSSLSIVAMCLEKRRVSVAEQEDEFGVEEIMELDTPQFNSSEGGWSEVQGVTEKKQDAKVCVCVCVWGCVCGGG